VQTARGDPEVDILGVRSV